MISEHIYPSLPFDSNEIKKYRREAQHDIENDEFIMFLLFRPISIYFSVFFFKKTNLTANTITFIMSVFGIIGPIAVVFCETALQVTLVTFAYILITGLLDVIDGEVARLRRTPSTVGLILDASLWFYYPLMYVVFVFKISIIFNLMEYFSLLVAVGIFHELYSFFSLYVFTQNGKRETVKSQSLIKKVIKLPFSRVIYFFIMLPISYFTDEGTFAIIFIYYTSVISIVYFVYSSITLTIHLQSFK